MFCLEAEQFHVVSRLRVQDAAAPALGSRKRVARSVFYMVAELLKTFRERRSPMAAPEPESSAADLPVPETDMDLRFWSVSRKSVYSTKCAELHRQPRLPVEVQQLRQWCLR